MLGPLFAWASIGPRYTKPELHQMVLLIMRFLADQLQGSYMTGCREASLEQGELFRLDAKAGGDNVCVGGWICRDG